MRVATVKTYYSTEKKGRGLGNIIHTEITSKNGSSSSSGTTTSIKFAAGRNNGSRLDGIQEDGTDDETASTGFVCDSSLRKTQQPPLSSTALAQQDQQLQQSLPPLISSTANEISLQQQKPIIKPSFPPKLPANDDDLDLDDQFISMVDYVRV